PRYGRYWPTSSGCRWTTGSRGSGTRSTSGGGPHRRSTTGPSPMREADVLRALAVRAQTLAVAESLTGGLLAASLVEVPGASRVLRGGLIVYATDLKTSLAGVPGDLLAERGPVDPDVAVALAVGARERCAATWGLGTTGVAGPEPQNGVPVGTVYVGCA